MIADLPLAEDIPVAFDSCRQGPRHLEWRDDKPAELAWIECQVGGRWLVWRWLIAVLGPGNIPHSL